MIEFRAAGIHRRGGRTGKWNSRSFSRHAGIRMTPRQNPCYRIVHYPSPCRNCFTQRSASRSGLGMR